MLKAGAVVLEGGEGAWEVIKGEIEVSQVLKVTDGRRDCFCSVLVRVADRGDRATITLDSSPVAMGIEVFHDWRTKGSPNSFLICSRICCSVLFCVAWELVMETEERDKEKEMLCSHFLVAVQAVCRWQSSFFLLASTF